MQISLIIPTLRRHDGLEKCIESFKGQYDELIIIDDKNASLAHKQNMGLRLATGTHLIVCNDDIEANTGTLSELCYPDKVVSPSIYGGTLKPFHGHMFCIPREIYAKVGGFDESCPGVYHIDSDLWLRLIKAGYPPIVSDKVEVFHNHPASTINTLDQSERDISKTRQWFIDKWGVEEMGRVGA